MDKYRKIGLAATGLAIMVGAFGVIASVLVQGHLATTVSFVSTVIIILLILIFAQQLLRNYETEERERNEDTLKLFDLVAGLQARLDTGVSDSKDLQTEFRRLVKAHHDEIIAVRHRLGALEKQVENSTRSLEAFKNEIRNSLRDSERRLAKSTPKAFEIKRAHERVEAAERRILGALETHSYDQVVIQSEQMHLTSTLVERLDPSPDPTDSSANDSTVLAPSQSRGFSA